MKALVVYDSAYGNTEKIAKAIAGAVGRSDEVELLLVADASLDSLESIDLLVVGSPTQGGKPTLAIQNYLKELPKDTLSSLRVAAFDTRYAIENQGLALRLLMKTVGFAAPRIAADLKSQGGELVAEPEGFIVSGKEGPLESSELERASAWMQKIIQSK